MTFSSLLIFQWPPCICKQISSHMKHTEDKIRTKILDKYLAITCAMSNQILIELVSKKQAQCS